MGGPSVFKILDQTEYDAARTSATWPGSAVDLRDGFIHLSAAGQVAGTLAAHFRGRSDLVLLRFDAASLGAALRWEPSRSGDLFPHLYRPLDVSEALDLWRIDVDINGACGLPELPE
jgi:uncharacterized protein (DUF952 family)